MRTGNRWIGLAIGDGLGDLQGRRNIADFPAVAASWNGMDGEHDLNDLRIDRTRWGQAGGSRRWIWAVVGLVIVAGLSVAAVGWIRVSAPVAVRTVVLRADSGAAEERTVLQASGYVTARRRATVSSKVTGKVVEVMIEEGDRVEEDQVLARLDDVNTRANLSLAEAELRAAESSLEETEVRLAHARKEYQRIQALAEEGVASRSERDLAETEVEALEARLHRQESDIAVARRQVELWHRQLEDTVIRAPFAGIVVDKSAQAGEMISPVSAGGGFTRTGICTLVDMDSLEIEVDVNESYINRVTPGQAVEATLDAYPDWRIPARVIAIVPTADRQKATVRVRIGFEVEDSRILPDMGVKVAFQETVDPENAGAPLLSIPESAVRRGAGETRVWVVRDGILEDRAISLGETRGSEVRVMSGLTEGERLVIVPPEGLAPGVRVREMQHIQAP